jgi:hypothetical protein
MEPPAPGRLSMMTGWPSFSDSVWAMARVVTSVALPGENGTTMWIGFSG